MIYHVGLRVLLSGGVTLYDALTNVCMGITFRATGMKVGLAVNPSTACIAEWGSYSRWCCLDIML